MNTFKDVLLERAVKVWNYRGIECIITVHQLEGHEEAKDYMRASTWDQVFAPYHCGYAIFPGRALLPDEIAEGIEVHGGITCAALSEDEGEVIYGFDCHHYNDWQDPKCEDIVWLTAETERMAQQLIDAYETQE